MGAIFLLEGIEAAIALSASEGLRLTFVGEYLKSEAS